MEGSALTVELTVEAREAAGKALSIPDQARALAVSDDESLRQANDLLLDIKTLRGKISDTFSPLVRKAHESHKAILKAQKDAEAPLVHAEGILKPGIARYMREVEERRRAEEERLRKEAEERAREEQLAGAIEAEQAGSISEAEAILEQPVFVPSVPAPPPPKLQGVSIRKVVKFEVADLRALVRAVAAGQVPVEALQANDVVIGAQARSLKGSLRWPGVRVWEEDLVSAGRR